MFDNRIRMQVYDHALACYPHEACGIIILVDDGVQMYVPAANISATIDSFSICPRDYAKAAAMGKIIAFAHSHPDASPHPSQNDINGCNASLLPWFIIEVPHGAAFILYPKTPPLIGREFAFGTWDCYTLARDFYRDELNIPLPQWTYCEKFWERGQNPYVEGFKAAGFVEIPAKDLAYGDGILMKVASRTISNHAAIYLGNEMILHHLYHRLSAREPLDHLYQKQATHFLRHRSRL